MSLEDIKQVRLEKLEKIKAKGVNPYPAKSSKTHTVAEVEAQFDVLAQKGEKVTLAGRLMGSRGQGAIIFADIFDGTGRFQLLFKKDEMDADSFSFFNDVIDAGDFLEASGTLFITRSGQRSLKVENWNILSKSLLPLPEKWHGLQDEETRFRKRYLDLLGSEETRAIFARRAKFWQSIREFLVSDGFLEVDTPTLEITTGGAEANPFKTHHKDFDLDVFLRISVGELWQKRLMAAGFPRTFEIGRVYRNEGSSPEHVQEFTNLELYAAYMDYTEGMELIEHMMKDVIAKVYGKTTFSARGHEFNIAGKWPTLDYVDTIKEKTGVDVLSATEDEMRAALDKLQVKYVGENKERLTDTLWKYCRKQIGGPAWLINHPKLVSPLSKENPENLGKVERAQLILAGAEVGNGWSELNDPLDQRARFELQQKLIESGDEEAMMPEWEFVEMLEHGMPPTFGYGLGERLFAFLEDKPIREVQLFPLMKPLTEEN